MEEYIDVQLTRREGKRLEGKEI